jgi:hypothetical protein
MNRSQNAGLPAAGPSSKQRARVLGAAGGPDRIRLAPTAVIGFQQRTAVTARGLSAPLLTVDAQPLSMNRLAWSKWRGLWIKGGLM